MFCSSIIRKKLSRLIWFTWHRPPKYFFKYCVPHHVYISNQKNYQTETRFHDIIAKIRKVQCFLIQPACQRTRNVILQRRQIGTSLTDLVHAEFMFISCSRILESFHCLRLKQPPAILQQFYRNSKLIPVAHIVECVWRHDETGDAQYCIGPPGGAFILILPTTAEWPTTSTRQKYLRPDADTSQQKRNSTWRTSTAYFFFQF